MASPSIFTLIKLENMKVPSLYFRAYFVLTDKNGCTQELFAFSETGTTEFTSILNKEYGIETSRSTVYKAKKIFTPTIFPLSTKDEMLGYAHWSLNCENKDGNVFERCHDRQYWIDTTPFVKIQIRIEKVNF